MYSSTLSLTSALDGGGCSSLFRGRLTPRKNPLPTVQEVGWAPRPVWMGAENLAPTGIRSADRPGRNETLYRQSYRGPCDEKVCVQEKRVEKRHCPQPQPLSCFCNLECKTYFKFFFMPDTFKPFNAPRLKVDACISFISIVVFLFT